jgi:glycosyltransferase involved in cell wall biosynthesis
LRFKEHNPSVQLFSSLALRAADHFIGVSQSVVDAAVRIAPSLEGETTVIPNGVNPDFLDLSSRWEETDHPIIAAVGNLRSVKGHDVLIRAISRLQDRYPELKLYIAGEGPERQALEQLANRLGLQDRVAFLGWCEQKEVQEMLQKASVFAMPSRNEGFGLALVEAMAAGLPVVASRVGGIPNLVDHERSGLLVPPEDPDALSESIDRVLSDDAFTAQLRAQARTRAQDFSWNQAVEKYEEVFERLA